MSYERNIFINCPFDDDYNSLLRPMLFTIVFLGYFPKLSNERSDSGETRINKICDLIKKSKYSIHDLSRLKPDEDEFSRQNMPFELGLDIGCRKFANDHLKEKKCLILEKERYRFMKALSDLSGSDIKDHSNNPSKLVIQVRNWFIETVELRDIPSGKQIWYNFTDFATDFYDKRKKENENFDDQELNMMPIPEYIYYIKEWCE